MPKTAYEAFRSKNAELEHQFRIYGGTEEDDSIELLNPGRTLRGKLSPAGAGKSKLEKKELWRRQWRRENEPEVTHKLDLVNKDGEYQTTIWTTTPENIKKALRSGLFNPREIRNPLAKMIAQIGLYKRSVYEDVIENGAYSSDYREKAFIAERTQDCLEALNALHACINNYHEGLTPQRNLQILIDKVKELIHEIDLIINKCQEEGEPYKTFREGLENLKTNARVYVAQLSSFQEAKKDKITREDLIENILRPYSLTISGDDLSMQHFLQNQINEINEFSVSANNMITSPRDSLMGSDPLGRSLLAARYTGEKFSNTKIDYHNPVTAEHAYDFSALANEEGLVTIDTEKFGFKPQTQLELLKGIDQFRIIEEEENILNRAEKRLEESLGERLKTGLGKAPSVIWRLGGNFIKDIGSFIFDLGYGLGYGVYAGIQWTRGKKIADPKFPGSHWAIFHKKEANEAAYHAANSQNGLAETIGESTHLSKTGFFEMIFTKLTRAARIVLLDPLTVIPELATISVNAAVDTWHDLAIGAPLDDKGMNCLLDECLAADRAIKASNDAEEILFINKYKNQHASSEFNEAAEQKKIAKYKDPGNIRQACVPYHLTPDDPCDTFSWATEDFLKELVEIFSHEIYRGHPLAGLAFTAAASTAAPMLVPALGHNLALHFINSKISVPIAHTFVSSNTAGFLPAFSTALIQGKLAYLAVDAMNGEDSLLARILRGAVENPVLAGSVCTVAVGFGYLMAYEMCVPELSTKLADETSGATFPYGELGLTGAKLAIILVDNTIHYTHKDKTPIAHIEGDDLIGNLLELNKKQIISDLALGYKRQHGKGGDLEPEDHAVIEELYKKYCNEFKRKFKAERLGDKARELADEMRDELGEEGDPMEEEAAARHAHSKAKEEIISKIAQLEPAARTKTQIRQILDYVRTTFPEDEEYFNAVKAKLKPDKKRGPIFNSIKIAISYAVKIITLRPLLSLAQWGWYSAKAYSKDDLREKEAAQIQANLARGRLGDFFRQAKHDSGRLVRGVAAVLRKSWDLVGSILHNMVETSLILMPKWRSGKLRSEMSRGFFAPGAVSGALNTAVGKTRASANAPNLNRASRDLVIRERLRNQGFLPVTMTTSASKARKSSSSSRIKESLLAQGNDWQTEPGTGKMRYKTFPKDAKGENISKSLKELLNGSASERTSGPSVPMPELVPGQTRAMEFTYDGGSKAVVIETLGEQNNELKSEIHSSDGRVDLVAVYDQIKSGMAELKRHHADQDAIPTVTLNGIHDPEMQKAYLLCCIKMDYCCRDDKDHEIYNPKRGESIIFMLEGKKVPLAALKEEYAWFFNPDFEVGSDAERKDTEELEHKDLSPRDDESKELSVMSEQEDDDVELNSVSDNGDDIDEDEIPGNGSGASP